MEVDGTPPALTRAVLEIERHVAEAGWDQPVRLFALVATADLVRREPRLAAALSAAGGHETVAPLTPVEQEELPDAASLEELLGGLAWPPEVLGTALVVERLVLPADAEAGMPAGEQEALTWLAEHPERREVRIAAGVLRDGTRMAALRVRDPARSGPAAGGRPPVPPEVGDEDVLTGPDLVPGLTDALAATLAD